MFGVKNWPKGIGRGIVWLIFWMLVVPVLSFFVWPLYATFMPFFKMLLSGTYTLKVDSKLYNSTEQSDSKSFWDFIKDTFAYKRTLLLFLAILNLFTCANKYLGEVYLGAVFVAIIFAVIFGDIFVNTKPNDNTMILQDINVQPKPMAKRPAKKVCMFPKEINRIDKILRKLNSELTEQLKRASKINVTADTLQFRNNLEDLRTEINLSLIHI